jgi:[CysO sulfur-carrier protein]-S-L-cysteine hydrolase
VLLGPGTLREVAAHSEREYPREACGLLLGTPSALVVLPCENLADRLHREDPMGFPRTARTAYAIHPSHILAADRDGTLRGVYHSHCDAEDHFSSEDRLQATMGLGEAAGPAFRGCGHLVVSVRDGQAVRATLWSYSDETSRFEAAEIYASL